MIFHPLKNFFKVIFLTGEERKYVRQIADSEYFDVLYYRRNNQSLLAKLFPIQHYVTIGEKAGLQPNSSFSPIHYTTLNIDLSTVVPLKHYIEYGYCEPRILLEQSEKGAHSSNNSGPYRFVAPHKPDNLETIINNLKSPIKFSIIVPLYNTSELLFTEMVQSVQEQWYQDWELLLIDDASPDENVRKMLEDIDHPQIIKILCEENLGISGATNIGLKNAKGHFVVFLDHDDLLTADCLYELSLCIDENEADFVYSDEDKIDYDGKFIQPHFKPDWSPDTLMSIMYTCHVSCVKRCLLEETGFLRSEFNGSQDWDLILRVTEKTDKICHIPKVLYHWRIIPESVASDISAKPYALDAGVRAREDALKRRGVQGTVETLPDLVVYQSVKYDVIGKPLVSIIIPSRDNADVLQRCIESIYQQTDYKNFEVIHVDNGSEKQETEKVLNKLQNEGMITTYRHVMPFNFAEMCNIGSEHAKGEILLFLNDDTEVLQADWLSRMIGYSQQKHIGAVGAKLIYPNSNLIQHAGVIHLKNGPSHAFLKMDDSEFGYVARNKLEYNWLAVTGACLMIERHKFEDVGRFSTDFPVAYNDVELCYRLYSNKFYNVMLPRVKLVHHESLSRGLDHEDPEKMKRLVESFKKLNSLYPEFASGDPFFNKNFQPNDYMFSEDFPIR